MIEVRTAVTEKAWELDPTERGLSAPDDIIEYLKQYDRCRTCPLLGKNGIELCAFELRLPSLRTKTMLMKTCEATIMTQGYGARPRHGRRTPSTATI